MVSSCNAALNSRSFRRARRAVNLRSTSFHNVIGTLVAVVFRFAVMLTLRPQGQLSFGDAYSALYIVLSLALSERKLHFCYQFL